MTALVTGDSGAGKRRRHGSSQLGHDAVSLDGDTAQHAAAWRSHGAAVIDATG